jgi:uncharacterized membrane protein
MSEAPGLKFHPLVLVPFIITLVWALMMVAAPLSLPAGSVTDLSGAVGTRDNADQTAKMNPFAKWVYDSGDFNCHQKASRSLFINGNEMPYCSRCVGIFFGLAIGTAISLFYIVELRLRYIAAALLPIGIDGGMQMLGFWESTNPVRLATGGLAGALTGMALGYIFFVIGMALKDRRRGRSHPGPQGAEKDIGGGDGRKDAEPVGLHGVDGAQDAGQYCQQHPGLHGAPDETGGGAQEQPPGREQARGGPSAAVPGGKGSECHHEDGPGRGQ